jgi:hypothetical protein
MARSPGRAAAVASLLLAPALAAATPSIDLPSPWRAGLRLEYASESRIDATDATGARERTRVADTTTVTVVRAGPGVVQDWTSRNAVFEALEGDPAKAATQRATMAALDGFVLRLTVDGDRNVRLDNLDALAGRLRPVARQAMTRQAEAALAKLPEAEREAARARLPSRVDGLLGQVTAPEALDPVVGRQPRAYLAYVGASLEPGRRVARDIDLALPDGGTVPAKLVTRLVPHPAHRNHAIVLWRATIDPERGAQAAWALAQRLSGAPLSAGAGLPAGLVVEDAGFVLIDRRDGVVELFENTRTVGFGAASKVERQRMRLTSGNHDHAWTDAPSAALVRE